MPDIKSVCEKEKRLYMIFRKSIESEREAQRLYLEAIDICDDQVLREVLRSLYSEEVRHEEQLLEYYNQLRRRYDTDGIEKLPLKAASIT